MIKRILAVHNQYLIRGGEDESFRTEVNLLRSQGIEVIELVENNERIKEIGVARAAVRSVWSNNSYKKVSETIKKHKVDIVHVHNYFPLISPSVFYAASDNRIPVVNTIQNYRLACLNGNFLYNGKVCESCSGNFVPIYGLLRRCYRGSFPGSVTVGSMLMFHRMLRTWRNKVSLFVTVTEFSKEKLVKLGLPEGKVVVKPNVVFPDPGVGDGSGDFALFVGRLSPEKGLSILLEAWESLGKRLPIKVIGTGPLEETVSKAAARIQGISFLGKKDVSEVLEIMGSAKFLVFPSIWYEGMPRTIIEAFAKGTPVIGSRLGAMESMINQRNGLFFSPGNHADLITKVDYYLKNHDLKKDLRKGARLEYEEKYSADRNINELMKIYEQAIGVEKSKKQ